MERPIVVRRRRNPLEFRQLLERFYLSGLSAVESRLRLEGTMQKSEWAP
jgi:hypothetical protein